VAPAAVPLAADVASHKKPRESAKAQAKAAAIAAAAAVEAASLPAATSSAAPSPSLSPLPASKGKPATASKAAAAKSDGSGGSWTGTIMLLGAAVAAYVFRSQLFAALSAYFPSDAKGSSTTPAKKETYKRVGRGEDDDNLSQTSNSCGVSGTESQDEIDPVAEEWAARLAAQREGREYTPKTPACGGAVPSGPGCGAVPNFASGSAAGGVAATEEEFDGFGGFEDDPAEEDDDGPDPAQAAAWGHQTPLPTGGYGHGFGSGMGSGPPPSSANWGDIGMLEQPSSVSGPTIDFGQLDTGSKQDDGIDWGILGDTGLVGAGGGRGGGRGGGDCGGGGGKGGKKKSDAHQDDDEEDEFAVFDGFEDGRAVLGAGTGQPGKKKKAAKASEGLSWDAERGLWKETKPQSAFGSLGSGGAWDLRAAGSAFRSPASLLRIRSQAEKIFNDNISDSIFTSPSMQRFKKQTDDMFATLTGTARRPPAAAGRLGLDGALIERRTRDTAPLRPGRALRRPTPSVHTPPLTRHCDCSWLARSLRAVRHFQGDQDLLLLVVQLRPWASKGRADALGCLYMALCLSARPRGGCTEQALLPLRPQEYDHSHCAPCPCCSGV